MDEEDASYIYIYIHTYTHNGILLNHKKNDILSFAITWVDLGSFVLSKISHTEKGKYYMLSHMCMWNLKDKNKQMYIAKQKMSTDTENN